VLEGKRPIEYLARQNTSSDRTNWASASSKVSLLNARLRAHQFIRELATTNSADLSHLSHDANRSSLAPATHGNVVGIASRAVDG